MKKERRKALSAVLVTLTVALLLTMSMSTANATTPTQIAGKFRPGTRAFTDMKAAGANAFCTFTFDPAKPGAYTGDMSGTFTQTVHWTSHFGDPQIVRDPTFNVNDPLTWPNSDFNVRVDRTFDGTVLGVPGTLTIHIEAKGWGRPGGVVSIEGKWVIISGTGGLANLHGQGTWKGPVSGWYDYEGQVHFEP